MGLGIWLTIGFVGPALWSADDALPRRWDFESAEVGRLAPHWQSRHAAVGNEWRVVEDAMAPAGAKVLAQTSATGPDKSFNLCVADDATFQDVDLAVAFKAVAGQHDRGGGLVWRYQDADNYYLVRMNPLEDNLRVYKVENGQRLQLESAEVTIASGKWHRLRVVARDDHFRCWLDDRLLLDVHDGTFAKAGRIGLWTKADAVTYFDDLTASDAAAQGDKDPSDQACDEGPAAKN